MPTKLAPTPARSRPDLPPLLNITPHIETDYLRGVIGRDRLREVLAHPSAPRPILGGTKGSAAIYSRDSIIEFFERIAATGWPTAAGSKP